MIVGVLRPLSGSGLITSPVQLAFDGLRSGRPIVLIDSRLRGSEGDLVVCGEFVTASVMAFLVRHTSGFVYVTLPGSGCTELQLPPMYAHGDRDGWRGGCRITIDAIDGTTTGISATDRATTVRALADASALHSVTRPGHVVPVRVHGEQPMASAALPEVAAALAGLAGVSPVCAYAGIVSPIDPTRMADDCELRDFARRPELAAVTIGEVLRHQLMHPDSSAQ